MLSIDGSPAVAETSGPKHIFVTGGVASSLGKGLTASSLGRLLKLRGLRANSLIKLSIICGGDFWYYLILQVN